MTETNPETDPETDPGTDRGTDAEFVRELREPSQRVSPRARTLWLVEAVLESAFTLAIALVVGYAWAPFDVAWWMPTLLAIVLGATTVGVPLWKYAVHRWEVTETAVHTQTGWWVLEQRIAPMSRIQTVDFAQGPLQRLFGLASVTVTTASAAGALHIVGLDRDLARSLVEDLTARADGPGGDAT